MRPRFPHRSISATIVAMLLIVAVVVIAQAQNSAPKDDVKWVTYVDPRFHFSVKYPSDWQVIPRDDSHPRALSGLLTFVPVEVSQFTGSQNHQGSGPQITIGLYLAEIEPSQSLSEWTERYESLSIASDEGSVQRQQRRVFEVGDVTAIHEEGISPVTTYQFTNLARGRTVWFIWTNIPSGPQSADSKVYRKMVRTFRVSKEMPSTLSEVYGSDFKSLDLNDNSRTPEVTDEALTSDDIEVTNLTSSWLSPVLKKSDGKFWNVQCGSDFHTGIIRWAADIGVGVGNKVYSARVGVVTWAGQHNSSYGNLIKIKASGGKEAFYAHLQSIYVQPGAHVSSPSQIALSGNSGGVDAHLHFHVQNGSDGENLVGMSGFYPKSNWPTDNDFPIDQDESCANMGR